jgi:FMN-dependent NADH-azoreductase
MENKKDLLFVDSCIRRGESRTRQLAESFLEELNKRDIFQIEELILSEEALMPLTGEFFQQRERLLEEGRLDHPRFRYAHRFAKADRILVAAPFWDLSVPALLKIYIENISVQGITLDVDSESYQLYGLCRADKLLFMTTRGGNYQDSPLETGLPLMQNLTEFFGIDRFDAIVADGMDLLLEPAQLILERAMGQARRLAESW